MFCNSVPLLKFDNFTGSLPCKEISMPIYAVYVLSYAMSRYRPAFSFLKVSRY